MKWEGKKQTDDFEDRTSGDQSSSNGTSGVDLTDILGQLGGSTSGQTSSSSGFPIPMKGGVLGIVVVLVMLFAGSNSNLGSILNSVTGGSTSPASSQKVTMGDSSDTRKAFSRTIFQMLEDYWQPEMQAYGISYRNPGLIIYSGSTRAPWGTATSDMGPFYSPSDQKVYLDTSFQDDVANNYGGSRGDFTMAYVLGHEFGHHIQNELGLSAALGRIQQQVSETEYNKYSVALELQADYFAGMWAKHLNDKGETILEPGDIDEALQTAQSIGDDTLQKKYQGQVHEESWTHGSSADRQKYFKLGYEYGDFEHADVFADKGLQNPVGGMPHK